MRKKLLRITSLAGLLIALLLHSCGRNNKPGISMPPAGTERQATWALPDDYHKQMDLTPAYIHTIDTGFVLAGHDDSTGTMLVRGYGRDGKKVWGQRLEGTCFGAVARGNAVAVFNIMLESLTSDKAFEPTYELVLLSASTGEVMFRQMLYPSEGLEFSRFLELGLDGSIYLLEEGYIDKPGFHLVRTHPDGTHPKALPVDLPARARINDLQFMPSGQIMIIGSMDLIGDTLMAALIDTSGKMLQLNLHPGMAISEYTSCIAQDGSVCVTGYPFEGFTLPFVKLNAKGEKVTQNAEAGISQNMNHGLMLHPMPNGHLLAVGAATIDTLKDGSREGMFAELDADGHLLRQERAKFGRIYELAGLLPIAEGKWLIAYRKTSKVGYNGYLELVTF